MKGENAGMRQGRITGDARVDEMIVNVCNMLEDLDKRGIRTSPQLIKELDRQNTDMLNSVKKGKKSRKEIARDYLENCNAIALLKAFGKK